MANLISPSPVVEVFINEVHRTFPESERNKIASYEEAIANTTSAGDAHRARLCVKWAIKMAHDKNQKHPRWAQLKERHQIWKDDWAAFDFGVISRCRRASSGAQSSHPQVVRGLVSRAKFPRRAGQCGQRYSRWCGPPQPPARPIDAEGSGGSSTSFEVPPLPVSGTRTSSTGQGYPRWALFSSPTQALAWKIPRGIYRSSFIKV